MKVVKVDAKNIPKTLSANTIYILQAGIYSIEGDLVMPSCTALI
jgi:hypothetical protein